MKSDIAKLRNENPGYHVFWGHDTTHGYKRPGDEYYQDKEHVWKTVDMQNKHWGVQTVYRRVKLSPDKVYPALTVNGVPFLQYLAANFPGSDSMREYEPLIKFIRGLENLMPEVIFYDSAIDYLSKCPRCLQTVPTSIMIKTNNDGMVCSSCA